MYHLHIATSDICLSNPVAGAIGKIRYLILVVSKRSTQFPLPVLLVDDCSIHTELNTTIGKSTFIGPVLLHTRQEVKFPGGKQVSSLVPENINASRDTILEEHTLQRQVPLCCCLPLDTTVRDVVEVKTNSVVCYLHALPISTGSIVIEVIITALVETGSQLKIVNSALRIREPLLVSDNPAQLHGGEDTPADTEHLEARLCIPTKTATGLHT